MPVFALGALALASGPAGAQADRRGGPDPRDRRETREAPFFDARAAEAAAGRGANAAQEALRRSLGVHGVVDVDPRTGTPRVVARLDGFLTGPSGRDAQDIALEYVLGHRDVFRLDESDLAGLRLVRDYTDVAGVRHLVWAQTSRGIAAFDNDLRANVTSDGRLLNVLGSPLPDLEAPATGLSLGAGGALAAALRDAGHDPPEPRVVARGRGAAQATRFAGGHRADLVLVADGDGVRLAWHVTAHADADEVYDSLVDAESGEVLRRANKVESVTGKAWDYYPGAPAGGTANVVDFTANGWLEAAATTLNGPFARVYKDLNDSNSVNTGEEVPPAAGNWNYDLNPFTHAAGFCSPNPGRPSVCSWNSYAPPPGFGWATNANQNGTQLFYLVNNFHDHLEDDPGIGFDEDSGSFEGADKVVAHALDGAAVGGGFLGDNMPDELHLNNANMLTLPDGQRPTMQMYLFTSSTADFATDPTPDVNGGDDAAIVYHEYTHGLSNRLVTYASGVGALDAHQSGSMGEAWSDWYALDYLNAQGFAPDTATAGDVTIDRYAGNGQPTIRTMGIDCPADVASASCPGGGYTYGDLATISELGAQVHADGEIWAQTLWDLRQDPDVGVAAARALVTEGMRLSPPNPSFLDMRNAILQADTALALDLDDDIWAVFAARGMGFFAATSGAQDTSPAENFDLPPPPGQVGSVSGIVTDPDTGAPVAGVRVAIPGNPADVSDVTDALGQYSIPNVPVGTYPLLRATKSLYDPGDGTGITVQNGLDTVVNLEIRRDWSAFAGGARVTSLTGEDYSNIGCGPKGAIDQSLASGWSSDAPGPGFPVPQITVKLPQFVDVKAFALDPSATCGDPADAGLAHFRLFVSKDGKTFTQVEDETFDATHSGRLNFLDVPDRNAIRYVRLRMLSNQGNQAFIDMTELSVYGKLRPGCLGLAATRLGTEGVNTMSGTNGRDVFVGLGGNDRFDGKGGNDVICGGSGNDTLIGGGGTDKFDAGAGADTVKAKDGRRETVIRGGGGNDLLVADPSDRATGFERRRG